MSLERALELAERGRGTTHTRTRSWARSSSRTARWSGRAGTSGRAARTPRWSRSRPPGRVRAERRSTSRSSRARTTARRRRARDALIAAGVARVVVGAEDPNPEVDGLGALREAGIEVEVVDSFEARVQNEAWRTWIAQGRPFVTYKAAVTFDGRTTLPGSRWITGEASRRLVHELRAASDAVAVGMGTVRADDPRLDARDVAGRAAAAAPRVRARAASRRLGARAAERAARRRSWRPSRPTASSRSCSREGRRSPRPSSPPASWTSCCSSSRRSLAGAGAGPRVGVAASPRRSRGCRCGRSGKTLY